MRISRSSSLLALLFVGVLAVPAGAAQSAAPRYVSSEPSNGEDVHQAPDRVEVTFNEPLDASSELTVKDSCGRTVDDGNVDVEANTMTVGIALKPSGHYKVTYLAKGLGGLTGQTDGEIHFEVHAGTACGKKSGGHGYHDDDDDRKKRHGRHSGGGDQDERHGNHGDGSGDEDHSSTNHSSGGGSGHSGTSHTDSSGSSHDNNANHAAAGNGRHGGKDGSEHGKMGSKHGKGHGSGHGDGHGLGDLGSDPDGTTSAAGPAAPFGAPNGTAVLTALGLSLALGVVGGWFLRISGGR